MFIGTVKTVHPHHYENLSLEEKYNAILTKVRDAETQLRSTNNELSAYTHYRMELEGMDGTFTEESDTPSGLVDLILCKMLDLDVVKINFRVQVDVITSEDKLNGEPVAI